MKYTITGDTLLIVNRTKYCYFIVKIAGGFPIEHSLISGQLEGAVDYTFRSVWPDILDPIRTLRVCRIPGIL